MEKYLRKASAIRRLRVADLNSKTAGVVKLDIPAAADRSAYLAGLMQLRTGSRLPEMFMQRVAQKVHLVSP